MSIPRITPCLIIDGKAEEATNFYVATFKNSKVHRVSRCGDAGPWPKGTVLVSAFELDGQQMLIINGGPPCEFTMAVSFSIDCKTQEEVDYFWDRLTADGGEPSMCGWLTDKYGVSWQVVPAVLPEMLADPDPAKSGRAMQAMMSMQKLDIAALQQAYDGP
ncbi:3-demethylubiquinone-9 3-methyltransferase [Pirellulimonas nuda]|uniref:3-demethylubiquinone-9 3-methyltransferase n=1 Tax=Pirellulimonas nuda TaxID=2528009 RepID=A0A518DH19_9BACT|nr:VOC family protein [Pirellulimonas nuda]QDU90732.1 3-demethylubiquinone-9 3-methyltransferase [Pirellulimonas nuda]